MSQPVVLGIETSQRCGGVGLIDPAGQEYAEPLRSAKRHDDDLMPAIDRLVRLAGLVPADLGLVAVSVGPGGFTGLRIAITTAKLLGDTLGVALAGVPSAMIAADSTKPTAGIGNGDLVVVSASKGESVWVSRMRAIPEPDSPPPGWSFLGEPGLMKTDELDLDGIAGVLGDSFLPDSLRARCHARKILVIEPQFDPLVCARIGLLRPESHVDPFTLAPIYAREPEALRLWESGS